MGFLILLGIIIAGCFMVIKTEWIYSFTGPIDWAEIHLGTEGGTRIFIKLLGVVIIIGALLWITGGTQALLKAILGPLIKTF